MSEVFAVDVGGTFTDLVMLDRATGASSLAKSPTTPRAPSEGVLEAIAKAGLRVDEARLFFHGTTLGINTLLEGKGAKVGLVTTQGFRDALELARLGWPMYQLFWEQPKPLVARSLRREVPERVRADGAVLQALDEAAFLAAVGELVAQGVEAVAVCFLHAYAYPGHERRAGELLEAEHPGLDFTLSHAVTEEYREYERTVTAVVNALIKRRMGAYIDELESSLQERRFGGEFLITRCDGGVMTAAEAKRQSIRTLISGPASGVMGAVALSRWIEMPNLIAIDMGGTSFDAALVMDGQPALSPIARLEGLPMLMPVVELATIGAGGGSIAWLDEGGALNVGPQSAGADPGPACYAKGGSAATFTDAALVTGLLDPAYFLGGDIDLDLDAATRAIRDGIAAPLGLDVVEAASGIVTISEAKMAATIEEITVGKGHDPRDFALLAYGGGGPLVAASLADRLEIPTVVVPPSPATFSAWGMLTLDVVHDFARTAAGDLEQLDPEAVEAQFGELQLRGQEALDREGVPRERQQMLRSIDMRYANQEHTLTVAVTSGEISATRLRELFDRQHEAAYGYDTDDAVELVTYRVRAVGTLEKPAKPRLEANASVDGAVKGRRTAFHRESGGELEWIVYDRARLGVGAEVSGPVIVEEPTCTTLVPPGWRLTVDGLGNLMLRREAGKEAR